MIHAISAGLGVALVPEQLKKLPHKMSCFAQSCRPWGRRLASHGKAKIRLLPRKTYVEIVEHVGRSIR
jgi:hypothetical protein